MAQKRGTLEAFGFKSSDHNAKKPKASTSESGETSGKDHETSGKDQSQAPADERPVYKKRFQNKWLSEFSWLRMDNGKMYCTKCEQYCKKHSSTKHIFIQGCSNYQRSTLVRHQKSDDHILSCSQEKQKNYMDAAVTIVKKKWEPLLEAQLRTALFLATENIANQKFLSLIDLQLSTAGLFTSTGPKQPQLSRSGIYTSNDTASKMQNCLAKVLKDNLLMRIQNSPYVGLMVDESLDICTTKKLVLFCKIVYGGKLRVEFCANVDVRDGKAETIYSIICEWLVSVGIGIDKVSGFGSDGASVMCGRHSGVGVRLKADNDKLVHVWCAAHKLALVSYWAAKKVPYLETIQEILINIYNFFEFSAPRYNKLRELKTILGGKVKKLKKPTSVRWLSLQDAVEAIHTSWSALVLGLEHEVATNPRSEGGNKAKGLLKKVKTFKFISSICLLKDILGWICKLSRFFQKDVIDIHQCTSMIKATRDTISFYNDVIETPSVETLISFIDDSDMYQGIPLSCSLRDRLILMKIRQDFISNILQQFDQRFPEQDMKLLKDMNAILNPALLPEDQNSIHNYGIDELDCVLTFFGDCFDRQEMTNSFLQFKFFLNVNRHLSLKDFCLLLINNPDHANNFSGFSKMAALSITVPLTSVPCERGFSSQNRHLSKYTNRRSVKNVENRMMIEYSSRQPDFNVESLIQRACELF